MTDSQAVEPVRESVADWEHEFDALAERLGRHVPRVDARRRVVGYVETLLDDVKRRNSWQLAEAAGHPRRMPSSICWPCQMVGGQRTRCSACVCP